MTSLELKKLLLSSSLLVGASAMGFANTAYAQSADEPMVETVNEAVEEAEDDDGDIVVTGTRIKRDTFSSIQPLQQINIKEQQDLGLFDATTILQQSEFSAGQQVDATFQGFVLDNGPGQEQVNLRGLGGARTLVLLNDRRVSPSGVEGAPTTPSTNQLPSLMVEQFDLLTDGASSVYGSDAVAGVINVILRQDYDGFEAAARGNLTEQGGTFDWTAMGAWGKVTDRGKIGFAAEMDFREEIKLNDRDFLRDCQTNVEITEDGEIRRQDIFDQTRFDVWYGGSAGAIQAADQSECVANSIAGRVIEFTGTFGSFYQDSRSNTGIPGYSDQNFFSVPIDANSDGIQDLGFQQFSINGNDPTASLSSEQTRYNLFSYGDYTFEGKHNLTPFYDAYYSRTEIRSDSRSPQLFPNVSAANPFNPCGVNGVDCGAGVADIISNPGYRARFGLFYADSDPNRDGDTSDERICARFGFTSTTCVPELFGLGGPGDLLGPQAVLPVVSVRGDRDSFDVDIDNIRLVGGVRGDLPGINFGSINDFSFEASYSYSKSSGFSTRPGIRNDRLALALGQDTVTGADLAGGACDAGSNSTALSSDVTAGCVPVNLFAPSLYTGVVGDFASQAERDYLFDDRDFDTDYTQTVLNAFITGDLFELPGGTAKVVIGSEFRSDKLDSTPGNVAENGLFFGFFSDSGASGDKTTKELFAEIDLPLLAGKKFFDKVDLNLSGRITEDEFYGTNSTYSVKAGWRPVAPFLIRGSIGTSFRAPNIAENFLRGQSGFNNIFDPCIVPGNAITRDFDGNITYVPGNDTREPEVLARCIREGLDPTSLGIDKVNNTLANNVNSTEVNRSGSFDLNPETSVSKTFGFSFEESLSDSFDLSLGATYFEIQVEDSIVQPTGQFLVNECFTNDNDNRSPFCDRISRDADGIIDLLSAGFVNRDSEEVRGVDYNLRMTKDTQMFGRNVDFIVNARANQLLESSETLLDDEGNEITDEDIERFGLPEWTASGSLTARIDEDWAVTWGTRFVDAVSQDPAGIDDFGDALGTSGALADTCGGPAVGDVLCRDVGFADEYFVHSISAGYSADTWSITGGIRNILNESPPEVDGSEVFSISNVPVGNGYDLDGRTFFVNLRKNF